MSKWNQTQQTFDGEKERGSVVIDGETIGYTLYEIDARTESQRVENERNNRLDGNLMVFIPGHGQRATYARSLQNTIVRLCSSKVSWSLDVDPARGGDPIKAEALIEIVKRKAGTCPYGVDIQVRDTAKPSSPRVTLIGWSHGGADALRAAEKDPALVQFVVILCPAGLTERGLFELLVSFGLENIRIWWDGLKRGVSTSIRVMEMGVDLVLGIGTDLLRSRSLRRVIDDIRWGATKVVGENYAFDGTVVILFGKTDTVIRWEDAFPDCQHPDEIGLFLEEYQEKKFPRVDRLSVQVLKGNHMAPEVFAPLYIKTAFDILHDHNVQSIS